MIRSPIKKQNGHNTKKIIIRAMVVIKKLNKILHDKFDGDTKRQVNNHLYRLMWGLTRLSKIPGKMTLSSFEILLDDAEQVANNYFEEIRDNEFQALLFLHKNLKIGVEK